jgi:ACR3 family arsenite transporter
MVFVWSHLTKGNAAYTVVQVATNDLIILIAFTPIVALLLGIGGVTISWATLILSVVLFVVIPLAGGAITQYHTKKNMDLFILKRALFEIRECHHYRLTTDACHYLFFQGR